MIAKCSSCGFRINYCNINPNAWIVNVSIPAGDALCNSSPYSIQGHDHQQCHFLLNEAEESVEIYTT